VSRTCLGRSLSSDSPVQAAVDVGPLRDEPIDAGSTFYGRQLWSTAPGSLGLALTLLEQPGGQGAFLNTRAGQLVGVTSCPADERDSRLLALDDVVNLEHFRLTGVDAALGENRHEARSERLELFL
jgi:hypothetical protein